MALRIGGAFECLSPAPSPRRLSARALRWGEQDSNLRRQSQWVYSPSPLTTRTSPREVRRRILERVRGSVCGPHGEPAAPGAALRAAATGRAAGRALRPVPQPLCLREHLELLQGVVLDLADPLARDPEGAAHLLERPSLRAREPEAHLDHLALARGQGVQCLAHVLAAEVFERHVERRLGLLVLDEVAELRVLLLTDRLLQRNR